jgi:acetyl-CoA carboxylase carboxyl transferase subunit alpha
MAYDLDFERPLAEIDKKLTGLLQKRGDKQKLEERRQIEELERQLEEKTRAIYGGLTPWQKVQVARHRDRPYTADYIKLICDDFFELRGDRRYGDDRALMGGIASIDGKTVMILGHQKGRDTKEKQECSFGLAHPEGSRKALRLMRHAERFRMPLVALVDTQGASPDLESELRSVSQAIGENLYVMSVLRTPSVAIVIGEGGSGGALQISVTDRILMLEHAFYTVASPEAAASILWREASFAANAAEAMRITAQDLYELRLIDGIIPEPLGGAHTDHRLAASLVKEAILSQLAELERIPLDTVLEQRYQRYRSIGIFAGEPVGAGAG